MGIPYPSRRTYAWQTGEHDLTLSQAVRIFQRMRSQHPKERNPQRYATMTRMIEVLYQINHQHDVERFPRSKVYKLFCAAADECQWYTDPTQYRKRRLDAPIGLLHCTGCDQLLPEGLFISGHLSHLCAGCRDVREKRKREEEDQRASRLLFERFPVLVGVEDVPAGYLTMTRQEFIEGRRAGWKAKRTDETVKLVIRRELTDRQHEGIRAYKVKLLGKQRRVLPSISLSPDEQVYADIHPYYAETLRILYRDTKQAINRHTTGGTPNESKAEYYRALLTALQQARQELDDRLDEGTLDGLAKGQVHWTRLLDDEQLEALEQARHELIAASPRGAKLPELTTYKELEAKARVVEDLWRAWQRHLTEQRKEDAIKRRQKRKVIR